MENHEEKLQSEVVSINAPTLEIDGVEELEERLEMGVCGRDCCKYWSYGRC